MAETLITYSWLLGSVCFVVGFLLLQLYKILWRMDSPSYNLPPGSTGWPLIGETFSFTRAMNSGTQPRQFLQDRERRYGEIFRSNLFGRPRLVVSVDPEFNKHVMQQEGRQFEAHYIKSTRNLIGKLSMVSVHGDFHRKLHGMAVNLLRLERLSVDFMEDIQDLMHTTFVKWQAKNDIHLQQECQQLVLNLIAKQVLGLSPSKETEEICEAFELFSEGVVTVPIRIPSTAYARAFKAKEFLLKEIYKVIENRRKHPQAFHNDLLTKILEEGSLSEEMIVDFILLLLFAGHKTSSRSMAFAIKFLTDCPQAYQELKAEHDALLQRKRILRNEKLTWDDYQSMKFTQCVINETLRLGSFGPGVFRRAKEDIKIKGGFLIPRGWSVFVLMAGTHLNDKYHSSALTFNPWRWQQQLQNQELSNNPSFMPFGGGARLCPGMHLAKLELALFLHNFVTKFRWEALKDDKILYLPIPSLSKGFPIRLRLRERTDDESHQSRFSFMDY